MEILFRKKGTRKWEEVGEQKFANEAELQNILYESPDIIPIEKLGENLKEPKLFVKEAGLPGSGSTDLIGIDEEGGITIIECKLATNPDTRRKVIGQVLEYAAYLWQITYEDFDGICSKAENWGQNGLADVMQQKMEGIEEPWSAEEFRHRISATLVNGDFRLIVAVDKLNDELRRIIQYVNSRGKGSPRIYALEMRQFATSELQMLVPELFGPTIVEPPPPLPSITEHLESADVSVRQHVHRLHNELISRFKLMPRPTPKTIAYGLPDPATQKDQWLGIWPTGYKPSAPDVIAVQVSRELMRCSGGDPDDLYQQFIQQGLEALPPAKYQQTLLIRASTDMDNWLDAFGKYCLPDLPEHARG